MTGFKGVYVSAEDQSVWEQSKKIASREGKSRSEIVMDLLKEYVRLHEPGNPQQLLTRYEDHVKGYVAPRKCSFLSCPNNAKAVLEWISEIGDRKGARYAFCGKHTEQRLKQTHLWKDTGLKLNDMMSEEEFRAHHKQFQISGPEGE